MIGFSDGRESVIFCTDIFSEFFKVSGVVSYASYMAVLPTLSRLAFQMVCLLITRALYIPNPLHEGLPVFQKWLKERVQPRSSLTWPYICGAVRLAAALLHLIALTLPGIGDFEDHCRGLASTQTGFTTWATLPELNDAVFPPFLDPANYTSVMDHCYPSLRRILDAIDSQARANPHISSLHVLHDGAWDHPMVYLQYYKLEAAVKSPQRILRAGWTGGPMKVVTHSGSLPVRRVESDWAVAVDVDLAVGAEVFIGNGYSSLSSQIIALRLAKRGARTRDITLL